jgi:hypothetical protein
MTDETNTALPQECSGSEQLNWLTNSLKELAEKKHILRQQPKFITKPFISQGKILGPYIPTTEELTRDLAKLQETQLLHRERMQASALLNCGKKSA